MTRSLTYILLAIAALLVPSIGIGAEGITLRPLVSIYADNTGLGIKQPEGVACSMWPKIVIADSGNGRLLIYSLEGERIKTEEEIKIPQLGYPIRVQADSKGVIFALDGKNRRIVRIGPGGEFRGYVGQDETAPSRNLVPRSFKIDKNDNIYLLDIFSEKIFVLDPSGKYTRDIEFPKNAGFISDIAVDAKGTIFLIDSIRSVIFVAAKEEKTFRPLTESMKEKMRFPVSIESDNRGLLYISDQNGSFVVIFDKDGVLKDRKLNLGWKEGLLYYPSQLCVSDKGEFVISDRENNRIQVFSSTR